MLHAAILTVLFILPAPATAAEKSVADRLAPFAAAARQPLVGESEANNGGRYEGRLATAGPLGFKVTRFAFLGDGRQLATTTLEFRFLENPAKEFVATISREDLLRTPKGEKRIKTEMVCACDVGFDPDSRETKLSMSCYKPDPIYRSETNMPSLWRREDGAWLRTFILTLTHTKAFELYEGMAFGAGGKRKEITIGSNP